MKHAVRISLILSIIVLGYLTIMSILTPIHFDEERALREKAIIGNLVNIRKAQIEFKNQRFNKLTVCKVEKPTERDKYGRT